MVTNNIFQTKKGWFKMNDYLEEALRAEYDRCREVMDEYDEGSDRYQEAAKRSLAILSEMNSYVKVQEERLTKEAEQSIVDGHNREEERLEREKLNQNLEIEHIRNTANAEIEKSKRAQNNIRLAVEVGGTLLAAIVTGLFSWKHLKEEERFAEEGHVHPKLGNARPPKTPEPNDVLKKWF
jgi:uncharacterized membrane protein YqiK